MKIKFNEAAGKMKPMHATNNGPSVQLKDIELDQLHPFNNNLYEFKNAGIPYARTHDTSFYHRNGLEHTVDVYYLFPDFDADPTDPQNYDFACTDHYIAGCQLADTEIFYRLGHRIEHEVKRYGIHPPKDFHKWAVICEYIIRHYTEAWADGFHYKMTYWEIWNEPDLRWNTAGPKESPTWAGTQAQFFEFYHVVATHLKKCFPHLKIGGPALASDFGWAEDFLKQLKAPLDFFSWHRYACTVEDVLKKSREARALLDQYGFEKTESILNEWNYVLGWKGDDIVYSHEQRRKIKGASFTVATMCACQYSDTDMLMYYDARPNEFWNGMFDDMVIGRVLKGYYPFPMFNTLYRLGNCVEIVELEEYAYACAAKGEEEAAILATYFNNDDQAPEKKIPIQISDFGFASGTKVELYLLDDNHDNELMGEATYYGDHFELELPFPNYTAYLIKLKKVGKPLDRSGMT